MPRFDSKYVPKSAMTIFAHPDDAEFGVAGTLAHWAKAGCEITLVLCTSGNVGTHDARYTPETLAKVRMQEQAVAARILGVKHIVQLDYDDCRLQPTLDMRRDLVREIRRGRPEVVVCGQPDGWLYGSEYINHPDHRAAAAAALEAVFPCAEMELLWPELGPAHKVAAVYVTLTEQADVWIDIADTIDLKIEALRAHASQMLDWDPDGPIRAWAAGAAKQARRARKKQAKKRKPKLKYAEGFRVMKLIEDSQEKPAEK